MLQRADNLSWNSRRVEYLYYFIVAYSLTAGYLGIEIPLVAASMTTFLAAYCFLTSRANARQLYAPIALLLACQISFVLVQVTVHDVSIIEEAIRSFFLWTCGMIIVQSLYLRPGFLNRCTIVLFALGLIAVPHLAFTTDIVDRAHADIQIGGGLRNANGLGVWFGFCAVFFALAGLITKRNATRLLYWPAALGSLVIVGLTVSRGALIGSAIAII